MILLMLKKFGERNKMTNEKLENNLNQIKNNLFGNLAGKVNIINTNKETALFTRKIEFGTIPLYFEYDVNKNEINKIYLNSYRNRKKVIYDRKQKILNSEELKKYNLIK